VLAVESEEEEHEEESEEGMHAQAGARVCTTSTCAKQLVRKAADASSSSRVRALYVASGVSSKSPVCACALR